MKKIWEFVVEQFMMLVDAYDLDRFISIDDFISARDLSFGRLLQFAGVVVLTAVVTIFFAAFVLGFFGLMAFIFYISFSYMWPLWLLIVCIMVPRWVYVKMKVMKKTENERTKEKMNS